MPESSVNVGIALGDLQRRLIAEPIEGIRLDSKNSRPGRQGRERADGRDPCIPKPPDLVPGNVRNKGEMIGGLPIRFTAALPPAGRTMSTRFPDR